MFFFKYTLGFFNKQLKHSLNMLNKINTQTHRQIRGHSPKKLHEKSATDLRFTQEESHAESVSEGLGSWVFCFMQHFPSFSLFWSQSELSKSYEDCSFLMLFNCRRLPNKCEGLCGTMTQVKVYLRFPTFRRIRVPKISDKLRFLDLFIGGSRAEGNTSGAAGDSQQSTESWMFWCAVSLVSRGVSLFWLYPQVC